MAAIKFTDRWLQALKPPVGRRVEYYDAKQPSLSLRHTDTGRRTWYTLYRVAGYRAFRRLRLGDYPAYSLAQARRLAAETVLAAQRGEDKREARNARKTAPTVADLIDEFGEHHAKNLSSGVEAIRILKKDVLPYWKDRKASDLRRRDLVLVRDKIIERGSPIMANRVQGLVIKLFNFAVDRDILPASPFAGMRKHQEQPRDRHLTDDEIKQFFKALESAPVTEGVRIALRLVLITGQRPGEVSAIMRTDISGDTWTLPAVKTKKRRAHRVPLTPLALKLFEAAAAIEPDSEYYFPSPTGPGPITRAALSRAIARMGIKLEPFTPHDLRRTCRTGLSALGVDHLVAELVLNHKPSGMQAVYDLYSYDKEKREALEAWAEHLEALIQAADE